MKPEELRIALFSGNYNYVRDGANQALNRLVGFLLRQGSRPRLFADGRTSCLSGHRGPGRRTVAAPFEYHLAYRLPARVRRDIAAFNPNVFHVAAPDIVAHAP